MTPEEFEKFKNNPRNVMILSGVYGIGLLVLVLVSIFIR